MTLENLLFRPLAAADRTAGLEVINLAAQWYREFLPPDQVHDREMSEADWDREAARMTWYGALAAGRMIGVMGLEPRGEVALVRHGYVLPEWQRRGVGGLLLGHLEREARPVSRIIVGTYAANYKARASLEKAGYVLSEDSQAVLRRYYAIPADRAASSVTYEKAL